MASPVDIDPSTSPTGLSDVMLLWREYGIWRLELFHEPWFLFHQIFDNTGNVLHSVLNTWKGEYTVVTITVIRFDQSITNIPSWTAMLLFTKMS